MTTPRPVVLCVDDDQRTLEILNRILTPLPIECHFAARPRQALELARQRPPRLLILDLMMPEMDGWQVLERVRAEHPQADILVIVLTARDGGLERIIARNVARVDVFLGKPFNGPELARTVTRLLNLPPTAQPAAAPPTASGS